MPLPAPPQPCVAVKLHWFLAEDTRAVSTAHFRYSGGSPSQQNLNDLAATIGQAAVSVFGPLLSTAYQLGVVDVIDLNSGIGLAGTGGTAVTGSHAGAYLPASACMVLNLKIARRYRGGHPRLYLPFGSQSDLADAQTWTNAFGASVAQAWNTFAADVSTLSQGTTQLGAQVNISWYSGLSPYQKNGRTYYRPTLRGTPIIDSIVTTTARKHIGSQRRRLLK